MIRKSTATILLVIIGLSIWLYLPHFQVDQFDISPNNTDEEKRADLENQYRTTITQAFVGIAVLYGVYQTWQRISIAATDLTVSREGQITERFTRAIDQLGATDELGNPALEIRMGGIYALERISKESNEDYWPIIEILTAYVRKNSSFEIPGNKKVMQISMDIQANESTTSEVPEIRKISLDIQAVLTVLSRREHFYGYGETNPLNLEFTCLKGADLKEAHLEESHLEESHLEGAYLAGADLAGAYLEGVHLEGADLKGADLAGAHLAGADLAGADLGDADLTGAFLKDADLTGAFLGETDLTGAFLAGADLTGAENLTIDQLFKVETLYNAKNLDEELCRLLEQNYPEKYQALTKKPDYYD